MEKNVNENVHTAPVTTHTDVRTRSARLQQNYLFETPRREIVHRFSVTYSDVRVVVEIRELSVRGELSVHVDRPKFSFPTREIKTNKKRAPPH